MDEIEDKNGNIVHAQGLEKLILLKCPFYAVPLQIPTAFSTEIQQTLKVCMESQRPLKIKGILRMKNKAIGITPPDFKLHYKTPVIKTLMVLIIGITHTHRSMGQNKELKNKPMHTVNKFTRNKIIQWGKDNGLKDLNVNLETIKLRKRNPVAKLLDVSLGNHLLDLTSETKAIKAIISESASN